MLINVCTAVFQGGVFGAAGAFPPAYMGAVMAGQAMGGIFPALVDIIVLALDVKDKNVGFVCFLIATAVLIASLVAFAWMSSANFFKFYTATSNGDSPNQQEQGGSSSIVNVIRKSWHYLVSVYLIFGTTLAAFPAVTVLVESTHRSENTEWATKYFTPVTCFLLFNCGDYAGRTLATYVLRPKGDSQGRNYALMVMSFLRIGFIPLFMLCNAAPTKRTMPVVFESDTFYIVLMAAFALSNGYLGNICMVLGPQNFSSSKDQELAAMVLVACLVLGTGSGSFISYPIVSSI